MTDKLRASRFGLTAGQTHAIESVSPQFRGVSDSTTMSKNEDVGAVVRWPQLKQEVPLSRVTVWRWAKEGKFPRPVSLGPHCSGWLRSEIEEWKRSRIAVRDAAVAAARAGVTP